MKALVGYVAESVAKATVVACSVGMGSIEVLGNVAEAKDVEESAPELLAHGAVEEEIDGGVDEGGNIEKVSNVVVHL